MAVALALKFYLLHNQIFGRWPKFLTNNLKNTDHFGHNDQIIEKVLHINIAFIVVKMAGSFLNICKFGKLAENSERTNKPASQTQRKS